MRGRGAGHVVEKPGELVSSDFRGAGDGVELRESLAVLPPHPGAAARRVQGYARLPRCLRPAERPSTVGMPVKATAR